MSALDAGRRAAILEGIDALIRRHLPPAEAAALVELNHRFHAQAPLEDLEGRHPEDVFGALVSIRDAFAAYRTDEARVRVFNPTLDADGWSSAHTIVQIHQRDMPFVVDSFLMALARAGLTLHCMHNVVLAVRRDAGGALLGFADEPVEGARDEVFVHAEVDRLDTAEFEAFAADLRETVADVRGVVGDFGALREQVRAMIAAAEATAPFVGPGEVDEARAFLQWLLENHFTFLGFREFEIADEGGASVVRQVPGSELGVLRLRPKPARTRRLDAMSPRMRAFILEPRALQFSKGGTRSRVHRPAYPDYVAVKRFDGEGRVVGELGVLGLWTSNVYMEPPERIPVLRRRVAAVLRASGFDPGGFDGKVLRQVLATFPRDELFQSEPDELLDTALRITRNHERNRLQVFVRQDRYGMFFSCLVYTPREIYTTALREGIQGILVEELGAVDVEFTSYFSESVLIRTHFVLRVDPERPVIWDAARIEARVRAFARRWEDDLREALVAEHGEHRARGLLDRYRGAFTAAYRERFDGRMAVYDIGHLERLGAGRDLVMRLYRHPEDAPNRVRLKVFHRGGMLPLSDLLPLLENLGVRVQEQRPFPVTPRGEDAPRTLHDFLLEHDRALDLRRVGPLFEAAFERIWRREAHNDGFNRLVLAAGLDWRDVAMLRAYARWLKQVRFPLDQSFVADTLVRQSALTARLVDYFHLCHDPARAEEDPEPTRAAILEDLDALPSLNEDRILRRCLELVDATLRTNFFQRDAVGAAKPQLAFKLASNRIPDVPRPTLPYEIFVCAPEMEGVHLRSGPIARGGLRWSDRVEDYRTEILGLVKAQRVKNAVIVPEGAKGGFVITAPTEGLDRDARQALGEACYRTFIRGLLDLTDNRVDGVAVPPADLRRHDGDDPYLVVAADKGTATFSDLANEVAAEYDFWIGDAFASGGSQGYDHKKMGITARGAWVSVQRHFRERGTDVQRDPVTVLGIGDMAGDVFGNGMLLSESIRLVAAFNHLHVFLDPDPDPAVSHEERRRLFALPRSSWDDYDRTRISQGGGVFARSQKWIPLSAEVRARFGLDAERLTPDELIHALLKAPVDLIWNGGIGTYVKASDETHADVGDRANDAVRVDGRALRCRVFGEGGNLGLTQRGRVEAARAGVALNTDFVDNSGGVDCSDHEVNIKLLLGEVVAAGDLTGKQRDALLVSMTEAVARLVLANNRRQTQALSLVERHARSRPGEYLRFAGRMEVEQELDRSLEQLPPDDVLLERQRAGGGLTRPELAVLLAWAKQYLKTRIVDTAVATAPWARPFGASEFPEGFAERFRDRIPEHFVYRHIVATQLANDLVHHMGVTFVSHLEEYTGANLEEVVRAWLVVRDVFGIAAHFEAVEGLPPEVPEEARLSILLSLMRLGRRACRWFLRHRRGQLEPPEQIAFFGPSVGELRRRWVAELAEAEAAEGPRQALLDAGVPEELAAIGSDAGRQVASLAVIEAATRAGRDVVETARLYAALARRLRLDALSEVIGGLEPQSLWQAMERDALLDDLVTLTGLLCQRLLRDGVAEPDGPDAWFAARPELEASCARVTADVLRDRSAGASADFSLHAMAVRKFGDLVRGL